MKILGANFSLEYITDRDSGDSGDCHNRYQRIRLQKDSHYEFMMDTLLHEILEAVNTKLEMNLDHRIITELAASIFAVMNDNEVDLRPLIKNIE